MCLSWLSQEVRRREEVARAAEVARREIIDRVEEQKVRLPLLHLPSRASHCISTAGSSAAAYWLIPCLHIRTCATGQRVI